MIGDPEIVDARPFRSAGRIRHQRPGRLRTHVAQVQTELHVLLSGRWRLEVERRDIRRPDRRSLRRDVVTLADRIAARPPEVIRLPGFQHGDQHREARPRWWAHRQVRDLHNVVSAPFSEAITAFLVMQTVASCRSDSRKRFQFALPWRRRSSRSRKRLDPRSTPDSEGDVACISCSLAAIFSNPVGGRRRKRSWRPKLRAPTRARRKSPRSGWART